MEYGQKCSHKSYRTLFKRECINLRVTDDEIKLPYKKKKADDEIMQKDRHKTPPATTCSNMLGSQRQWLQIKRIQHMQQNRKDPGILPKQPEPFRKHYPLTHGLLLTNPKQQQHFSKEMYTKFSRKQHIKIVNIIKTHNNVS